MDTHATPLPDPHDPPAEAALATPSSLRELSWDDLRIVDAAARTMSLSAAARHLGLSQPQLSRRLRAFEDVLGARLFDRTPQGLRPTAAGAQLIPLAAEMRQAADAVRRVRPELASAGLSCVRVSVDEVRERFLIERAARLMRLAPGVAFEIVSAHLHADHMRRETEIQLRSCLPETDTLIARRIGKIAYGVFGTSERLAEMPQTPSPVWSAFPWVGLAAEQLWYPEIQRWLEQAGAANVVMRVNTMTGALEAAAAGVGLAVLPVFMAAADPRLQRLGPLVEDIHCDENLIVHRDLLREPAVRMAVDAIAALYREERHLLAGAAEAMS